MQQYSSFTTQPFLHALPRNGDDATVPTPTPGAEDKQQTPPKFSTEQQARVDEIVREAMGRAGRDARAKVRELEAELSSLRTSASQDPEIRAELAALREERNRLKAERIEDIARNALMSVSAGFVDPNLFCDLARKNIRVSADGGLEVVGADGQPLLDDELRPMTVSQLAKRIGQERPYLVRGDMRYGSGSAESQSTPPPSDKALLPQLFGKNSNSKLANQLSLKDPKKYQRLRKAALAEGLI